MTLVVLHLLRVLSLGELPQHTWSVPLSPGHTYQIRRVTAEADGPFCLSTVEERSDKAPNRALSLGCWPGGGRAEVILREAAVKGRRGAAYSVILFVGPPPMKAAEFVVVTVDVERK